MQNIQGVKLQEIVGTKENWYYGIMDIEYFNTRGI